MARVPKTKTQDVTLELGVASLAAKRRLELRGLDVPEKPAAAQPDLPDDLTDLDDSELMTLFSRLTRWTNYLGAQLAAAEVDERYASAVLDKHKALKQIANSTEKTVTAAKARAYEDPEYLDVLDKAQAAYAYRKMISMMFEATDRKSALLSRELTRRVNRAPREGRDDRWGT